MEANITEAAAIWFDWKAARKPTSAKVKRFRLHAKWRASPGRRASQQRASQDPSRRSADSTSASFRGFSFYYIMQVGENLRLFLNTRQKKNSHTNRPRPLPFVWTLSLEGPSGAARREIIIFGLGYCYFFFGSHCCGYCQETGGELVGGEGAGGLLLFCTLPYKFLTYFLISLQRERVELT